MPNDSTSTRQVRLSPWCELTESQASGELVAFSVGADGLAYLVFALEPLDVRGGHQGSVFRPFSRSAQTYRVLACSDEGCLFEVAIAGESMNVSDIQPLGDDLLLVCARSHRRDSANFDRNAGVYSRNGHFLREFLLGDGISSVQVSPDNTIWTSYFDEGVFGNHGWHDPVGASGLVAWSSDGDRQYEFEPVSGLDSICDCYSLNVVSDRDVWISYYTDFPLVNIRNRKVHAFWDNPIAGSGAIAIGRGYAFIAGGYDNRSRFHLMKLESPPQVREIVRFELCDAQGQILKLGRVEGRGDAIVFPVGRAIYRWTVTDALSLAFA